MKGETAWSHWSTSRILRETNRCVFASQELLNPQVYSVPLRNSAKLLQMLSGEITAANLDPEASGLNSLYPLSRLIFRTLRNRDQYYLRFHKRKLQLGALQWQAHN